MQQGHTCRHGMHRTPAVKGRQENRHARAVFAPRALPRRSSVAHCRWRGESYTLWRDSPIRCGKDRYPEGTCHAPHTASAAKSASTDGSLGGRAWRQSGHSFASSAFQALWRADCFRNRKSIPPGTLQASATRTSGPFGKSVHALNGVPLLRKSSVEMPDHTAFAEQWHTRR
jgi:hypothetical protein